MRLEDPSDISKTGRRIRLRQDMLSVPVLRRMNRHRITTDPVQTVDMHPLIRRLGQYCGLEDRLVGYCFRRGVAYTLSTRTTAENRKFLMGHGDDGHRKDYYTPYQSKVSTIDFPAMFRGIEQVSVLPQAGVSLNRSDNAPLKVSAEGLKGIMADTRVVDATRTMETLRDRVLEKHPSLNAASKAMDPLWKDYHQAYTDRKALIVSLSNRIHREEYKAHFDALSARPSPRTGQISSSHNLGRVQISDISAHSDLTPDSSQSPNISHTESILSDNAVKHLMSTLAEDENIKYELDDDMVLSSNLNQSDDIALDEDRVLEILGEAQEEDEQLDGKSRLRHGTRTDPDESKDDVQIHVDSSEIATTSDSGESMRLHGLPDKIMGKGFNRAGMLKGVSAYNDMKADLEASGDNDEAISKCLTSWFSISHAIDEFWTGQEPHVGSFDCKFCGKDLNTENHSHVHAFECAKRAAHQQALQTRTELSPLDRPCEYQRCGHGATFQQFVLCGKTFETLAEQGEHMREHVRSMKKSSHGVKVRTCFFGDCAQNPKGGRIARDGPDFDTEEDLFHHLWSEHRVATFKAAEATFCEYCQTWLLEPYEWMSHADKHVEEAQRVVTEVGYAGYTAGRAILPRLCPFCFHDDSLPAHRRINTHSTTYALGKHVLAHLNDMNEDDGPLRCPCYPAMCTKPDLMDRVQMTEHLQHVHGVDVRGIGKGKRANGPLSDITNTASGSRKVRLKRE